jgi:hypothetical protein
MKNIDAGLEYTFPGARGICGFCGGEEGGYAKRDDKGVWQPACWPCVKPPKSIVPQKREQVGTVYSEDLDAEDIVKKKRQGLAPSTHRPKVN